MYARCYVLAVVSLTVIIGRDAVPAVSSWPAGPLAFFRPAPEVLPMDDPPAPRTRAPAPRVRPASPGAGQNRFYDGGNPDAGRLQQAHEALAGFPVDRQGMVDWGRTLEQGLIAPRAGLDSAAAADLLDLDVVMRNTRAMPHVRFPHLAHTRWLACANCHPQPFPYRVGTLRITMADLFRGRYCGMCHDRVAFVTWFACERCHSVPRTPVRR